MIRLKIAKKWWLYLDIFSCVKVNVFHFQTVDACQMREAEENWINGGRGRGTMLGRPRLFECMGICVPGA